MLSEIKAGKSHFYEKGLDALVHKVVFNGALRLSAIPTNAEVYIICVPTPLDLTHSTPEPDMSPVFDAVRSISEVLKPGALIILESTSPVGTTVQVMELLGELGSPITELNIAYCPERVLPGNTLLELLSNDRVVGGINLHSTEVAAEFYESFISGRVLKTDAKTAEMCKLAENSFRDVNIAFANELSMICANQNIDVNHLIALANRHPRVQILQAGPGVGGHCIAVDPWFIVASDPNSAKLIRQARRLTSSKQIGSSHK